MDLKQPRWQEQGERQKTVGLFEQTTIVHVDHAFGSFYLTSTAQIRREIRTCYETFCSVAGRERIFVFVLNLDKVLKIQTRFRLYSITKVSEVNKCDKVWKTFSLLPSPWLLDKATDDDDNNVDFDVNGIDFEVDVSLYFWW